MNYLLELLSQLALGFLPLLALCGALYGHKRWVVARRKRRLNREHVERINRQAPYKSEPPPVLPHADDILMWPTGTCVFRKNFLHSADIERYGHTYIVLPMGSADHHLVLNNLYGETDSLETTENEALL